MPSQLRRMLRQQGKDLHGDFLRAAALPAAAGPHPALDLAARRAHRGHARSAALLALALILGNLLGSPL